MLMNIDQRGIIGVFSKLNQHVYTDVYLFDLVQWWIIFIQLLTGERYWKVIYKMSGLWVAFVLEICGVLWNWRNGCLVKVTIACYWLFFFFMTWKKICVNLLCCCLDPVCPDACGIEAFFFYDREMQRWNHFRLWLFTQAAQFWCFAQLLAIELIWSKDQFSGKRLDLVCWC